MILKYFTKRDDYIDQWNYLDEIKVASVYYNEEARCTCVNITLQNGDEFALALHGTAYLLNESGKTIDRLAL